MRARVQILRIHVKARTAQQLLQSQPWGGRDYGWLSGLAESGLQAEREPNSKDKVDKDQGDIHRHLCFSTCMWVCIYAQTTPPQAPLPMHVNMHTDMTHIYTHTEDGNG